MLEALELQIHGQHLYLNGLADLPQLERLYVAQKDKMTEEDTYDLSQCLQDLRKLPALRQLEIHPECGAKSDSRVLEERLSGAGHQVREMEPATDARNLVVVSLHFW